MAKRNKITKDTRRCDECANGKWIEEHSNRDINGDYICLRCDYSKRARIRDECVCEKFKAKQ